MAPHAYHTNKWVTFTASTPVALSAGLTYTFAVWSEAVKARYGLSQQRLQLLAASCNLGGYSSIVAGLFYDFMERHHKMGPRLTLLFGSLPQRRRLPGWFDTAALVTNVRNFPHHRGHVVGVMKASVGLSAALYSAIYFLLLQPHASTYLLFLATVPSLAALVAVPLTNMVPYTQDCELERGQHIFTTEGRFLWALQSLCTLALYLMASQLFLNLHPELVTPSERIVLAAGAGILLLPLLVIPVGSGGLHVRRARPAAQQGSAGAAGAEGADARQPLLPASPGQGAAAARAAELARRMPSLGPRQCLTKSREFWLLFWVCVVGMGSSLTFINNLAQVWLALGGAPEGHTIFISLFGVLNAAARMAMGWLPEQALHVAGTPRPLFLVLASAGSACVCLGLALSTKLALLYPLTVGMGLCFGSFWTLMPALASELFGLANFASNYTLLQAAPAAGSFGLASWLASWWYQRALDRHSAPGSTTCLGADCFRPTWITLTVLGVTATAAALALYLRTRTVYTEVHGVQMRALDNVLASVEPYGSSTRDLAARVPEENEEEAGSLARSPRSPRGQPALPLPRDAAADGTCEFTV